MVSQLIPGDLLYFSEQVILGGEEGSDDSSGVGDCMKGGDSGTNKGDILWLLF